MQNIVAKIAAARRKHAMVAAGTGAAMVACVLVGGLVLTMLCDWFFELPFGVRAAALVANLIACLVIAWRWTILPIVRGPDDDQVSLWVEAREPMFAGRLITVVQMSRQDAAAAGVSPSMLRMLMQQVETLAASVDFTQVVPTDRMLKLISAAIMLIVLALVATVAGGETGRDLLQRALLVPGVELPRKTRIRVEPGDLLVARGEDVTIAAIAEGVIPSRGQIRVRHDSGRQQVVILEPIDPEGSPGHFARTIRNVQEQFTYTIELNDARSAEHAVRVETRPAVAGIEIRQIFPDYTGLPPLERSTGDLSILEGSRLAIRVRSNKPLRRTGGFEAVRNHVLLAGSGAQFRLEVDPHDPMLLVATDGAQQSIPVPATPSPTTGLSIHLVDEHGLQSSDPAVYPIDLVPDRPPAVRVTRPEQAEELVTARAQIPIAFDAADDFAISAARIVYEIRRPDDAPPTGGGLVGLYFDQETFDGKQVERVDATIDFRWGERRPHDQIEPHTFSVRWSGYIVPPESGSYVFLLEADDGVRLWIEDEQILDSWAYQHDARPSRPVEMEAGRPYRIRLDFHQSWGPSSCRLLWQRGAVREVVPAGVLWPSLEALDRSRIVASGSIPIALAGQRPRSVSVSHTWLLERLDPRPPLHSVIEWWVEVEDTNTVSGPGIGTSDRFLARIVTDDEKRADLMRRLDQTWTPIDSLADDQQKLNQDLGKIIIEQGE